MIIRNINSQTPFTTKDGSTIRSILDRSNSPAAHQSLAEATLPAGAATTRHKHAATEEFYFILDGSGIIEIDGEHASVQPGDAILIPPGTKHQIRAAETASLRFLCCCAPPYAHEDTFFD